MPLRSRRCQGLPGKPDLAARGAALGRPQSGMACWHTPRPTASVTHIWAVREETLTRPGEISDRTRPRGELWAGCQRSYSWKAITIKPRNRGAFQLATTPLGILAGQPQRKSRCPKGICRTPAAPSPGQGEPPTTLSGLPAPFATPSCNGPGRPKLSVPLGLYRPEKRYRFSDHPQKFPESPPSPPPDPLLVNTAFPRDQTRPVSN